MNRKCRLELRLVACLAIVLALCVDQGRADDAPTQIPLVAKDVPGQRLVWYGVYLRGTKSGYIRMETGRSGEGVGASYVRSVSTRMQLLSMGKQIQMDFTQRMEFDLSPPFLFQRAHYESTEGARSLVIDISVRADGSLSAQITEDGENRSLSLAPIEFTLADELTLERWLQSPRVVGDRCRIRSVNVKGLRAEINTYVVSARKESLAAGVSSIWYDVRQESESGEPQGMVRADATGRIISIDFAGLFEARLETEEQAKKIEFSADLFVFGQASIDVAIGHPAKVSHLVLDVDGPGAGRLSSGPRQSLVRNEQMGTVTVSLGLESNGQDAASPAEIEDALAETVDYPTKSPEVVSLLAAAIGGAKGTKERIVQLVRFVSDYVDAKERPQTASVQEIITSRWGDCTEHAKLFATLARAAGIPTREVSGLMYMGDDVRAFGGHMWNEVALDGKWIPVDPTWNQFPVDATHIAVGREGNRSASLVALGKVKFRLRELKRMP